MNSDLEAVRFGYASLRPGESHRLERHYYHTLFFVTGGCGSLDINGRIYQIEQGDVFYIPADISAKCTAPSAGSWAYSWCAFTGKFSVELMHTFFDISSDQYFISGIDTAHYAELIDSSLGLTSKSVSGYLRANSILFNILADISTELSLDNAMHGREDCGIAGRARNIIDRRFSEISQVQQVARELSVHPYYLSRVFRERFGISPKQYLMKLKFTEAARLLASTDIPVSNISASLGFEDQLSFSKSFRKHYNCSPTEYRKTHGTDDPSSGE